MAPKTREEKLFGAACLKLALERSRSGATESGGSEIYRETIRDLELTEEDVDAYLAENHALVQAALNARGRAKN